MFCLKVWKSHQRVAGKMFRKKSKEELIDSKGSAFSHQLLEKNVILLT